MALTLSEVPEPDAPWDAICAFSETFDGYTYLGKGWAEHSIARRDAYLASGVLSDALDDLRACLFCEFRMDRFQWGEEVILSEPDEGGVRAFQNNPDFEASGTQRYRRGIITKIRDLLAR